MDQSAVGSGTGEGIEVGTGVGERPGMPSPAMSVLLLSV